MKKIVSLIVFLCLIVASNAQVVFQESFDGTTFAPTGWYNTRILPSVSTTTNIWDWKTQGVNPVVDPHSGSAMAHFETWTSNGINSELGTPVINLSSGASHRLRFWLYRGSAYLNGLDRLEVYINTQTNITGATKLITVYVSKAQSPAEPVDGWYEYVCEIPASYNTASNYIIFRGISAYSPNQIYLDDVSVEEYTCNKPSSPLISNITTSSVTMNWSAPVNSSPSGYEWELRTIGSGGAGTTGLVISGNTTTGITTANASGLTQGATYKLFIRSVCGSEKSVWTDAISFTTLCNPYTIPYTENFDAFTTGIPYCTSLSNLNGGDTWKSLYPSSGSYSGVNALMNITGYASTTGPLSDWFFTAPLNLEANKCYSVSFRLAVNSSPLYQNLKVQIGTAQDAGTMGASNIVSLTNLSASDFQLIEGSFSVAQTGVYYIGFHNYSDVYTASGKVIIDDISVTEGIGMPTNISASSIQPNSATIAWNSPSCGTATGYEWELRSSAAPGSGATGLITSGSTIDLTTDISSLTDNSTYSFYVRASNGSLKSAWTNALVFKTSCIVKSIPYSENFDGRYAPNFPYCYVVQDVTAPYNSWNTWQIENSKAYSYPNCAQIGTTGSTYNGNNWMFTPPLSLVSGKSYRLSFYYHNYIYNYDEKLEVKYGKGANSSYMTSVPIFSNTDIRNSFYKKAVVDFVPSETGNYNMGFHYFSNSSRYKLYVDDIKVEETPKCDTVYDIKVKDITTQSVVINWSLPISGTPNGFIWEIRTSGIAGSGTSGLISDGSLVAATQTLNVTGLTNSTNYTFYIKSVCGTDSSSWVASAFTTACLPLPIPYNESFNSLSSNNLPECTTIEETKDVYKWYVNSSYHYSPPYALLHEGSSLSPLDDWFFSAPLDLKAGKSYHLSFYTKQVVSGYMDALEIYTGNFAQNESMSVTPIYVNNSISNTSYQLMSVDFTVSADGTYYLGFRWKPNNYTWAVVIDDISVSENTATAIRDVAAPANDLLLSVYPNPTEGELILKINRKYDAGKAVINIRDLQGRAVKTIEMKFNGSGNYLLQTTGLPAGMYLVEVLQSQSGRKQTVTIRKK